MRKSSARVMSAALVSALMFLTGCTGGGEGGRTTAPAEQGEGAEGTTSSRELYTIKLFNNDATKLKKWSDTPVGQEILNRFNIDVELIPPPSGDTKEQLGLMLAAGNYPEIVHLQDQDITNKYIEAGALVALDPYLDKMPNFTEWFKDSIPYWRQAAGDGKLYNWNSLLPQDQAVFPENNDMAVRTDLLEQQGWTTPVSADEWIAFLKKAKEDNPKTPDGKNTIGIVAPFGESWGMAGIAPILYEKGEGIQISNGSIFWHNGKQEYVDMFTYSDTKESFQFFNKLYQAGLLDEESFTDKWDQVFDKMTSGRALSAWYVVWGGGGANAALKEKGMEQLSYITMPIQSNGQLARGEKNVIMSQLTRPFDTIAITKNAKHPERLLELVDFMNSEEGQVLLQSGIEGVHYTIQDGKRVATDAFIQGRNADPDYNIKQGIGVISEFGMAASTSPVDNQPYNLALTEPVVKQTRSARVNEAYEKLGWETPLTWWEQNAEWATIGLASGIGLEQSSDEGVLEAKLADFRVKNTSKLIMAKDDAAFESLYNQLVQEYNAMNPQQVVDKYNELYKQGLEELKAFE
ncbi:MAG TPA: extracellular solute-binding protein [Paenibacillus sp.]|nr:extracellular solute-binding protein [Paenibacillus sp.]